MKLHKLSLNIALFVSLLIILVVGFYSIQAIADFNSYKKATNQNMELTQDRFKFFLKNTIEKDYIKLTAPKPLKDEESPLKTFRITVDQSDIDSLNANLPTSGKDHFIDAYMNVSDKKDKIYKVKMRYRGDNSFHWLFKKKSLRIKLANDDVYDMSKTFNLINPPMFLQIRDILSYDISSQLGILSPRYYFSRVFINNEYMGIYIFLDQVDESLLRRHKIMPGSVYFGEASPMNKDGIFDLCFNQKFWQKKAARNKEQKNIREDITHFINATTNYNINDFYNFVNTSINKQNYFSYIAMDRFIGSNHHDYGHNLKIYFDPYKGKFEPIQWDVRFWNNSKIKDESLYPFVLKLSENPIFDAEIDKILYEIIQKYPLEEIEKNYALLLNSVKSDSKSDINRDTAKVYPKLLSNPYWYSMPYKTKELEKQKKADIFNLSKRVEYLKELLNNTKLEYYVEDGYFYLNVIGNSPVKCIFPDTKSVIKKVYKDKLFNLNKEEILYSGRELVPNGQTKYSKLFMGSDIVKSTNQVYKFKIDSKIEIEEYLENILFTNHITNEKIKISKSKEPFDIASSKLHPWSFIRENKTITLKGTIKVNKTLIFDKHTEVIIEPNTTFIMDENSSIYFYGKVTAIGTKEKPIRFVAKDESKPWGLVAVQGKATTGSKFHYCEFENGSIDTHNLIHYTSQFNIHDMDWFEVRNCKIGRNFVGDDAMHIAYAKGIVDSCEFYDARSDALDIDISDVNITNNVFYNSGNDALDVMTTKMNASNNVFIDTGDKGISVGEWSEANITDSFFLRTVIGTEVKDKSEVIANNLVYVDSKEKAINLYNKNKRYDTGGFLNANEIYLLGNKTIKADKRSAFKIEKEKGFLPDIKSTKWYKNMQGTSYKKFIDEVEVKYAK